jgi:O2-independent ubiquinone biosynthesis accessory factor UbiT
MIRSYGSGKPSTGSAGRMPSRGAVLFPLRVASSIAMSIMMRRHPAVFERLSGLDQPTFLIEPRELPFGFLLHAGGARPRLEIVADPSVMRPTARIRGSLRALIELLEGSLDGDALFFSRELAVEGSTEAVVALRNAVDGAGVDVVADLLSILGPLSKPAQVIVRATGSAGVGIFRLLDAVRNIAMAPAARRLDSHDAKLSDIERRLAPLESRGHLRRRAPG